MDEFHWMAPVTAWIKLVVYVLKDWQSSVIFKTASPNVRKINRYSVLANRAAIALGLNPFTISHTAITISCGANTISK